MILTNDGDYIHQVISPAKHVSKRYFCSLEHEISEADIAAFENGILLADRVSLPARRTGTGRSRPGRAGALGLCNDTGRKISPGQTDVCCQSQ